MLYSDLERQVMREDSSSWASRLKADIAIKKLKRSFSKTDLFRFMQYLIKLIDSKLQILCFIFIALL